MVFIVIPFIYFFVCVFQAVFKTEHKALFLLGTCPTIELHPRKYNLSIFPETKHVSARA